MRARSVMLVLSVATAALVAAGAVSAAWVSSATGATQARAISGSEIVVTRALAPSTLYPGSTAGTIAVTVTNPNPYPVRVTAISSGEPAAITAEDVAGNPIPDCNASHGVSYNWAVKSGLDHVVAPDGGTFTYTLTGALAMSNASHADCAGAVFTVPVAVTAMSAAGAAPASPSNATVAVP